MKASVCPWSRARARVRSGFGEPAILGQPRTISIPADDLPQNCLMRAIRTVTATRYITPLREGGSLPAIVEADDDGMYVLKFVGAGQGPRALIAELVAGEIARALELPVPEIVFAELDSKLGRSEPDFEIQALIKAST